MTTPSPLPAPRSPPFPSLIILHSRSFILHPSSFILPLRLRICHVEFWPPRIRPAQKGLGVGTHCSSTLVGAPLPLARMFRAGEGDGAGDGGAQAKKSFPHRPRVPRTGPHFAATGAFANPGLVREPPLPSLSIIDHLSFIIPAPAPLSPPGSAVSGHGDPCPNPRRRG